jgi:hypothetical protein
MPKILPENGREKMSEDMLAPDDPLTRLIEEFNGNYFLMDAGDPVKKMQSLHKCTNGIARLISEKKGMRPVEVDSKHLVALNTVFENNYLSENPEHNLKFSESLPAFLVSLVAALTVYGHEQFAAKAASISSELAISDVTKEISHDVAEQKPFDTLVREFCREAGVPLPGYLVPRRQRHSHRGPGIDMGGRR